MPLHLTSVSRGLSTFGTHNLLSAPDALRKFISTTWFHTVQFLAQTRLTPRNV